MKKLIILILLFGLISSCQTVEKTELVVFDYNQFPKFDILCNSIEILDSFERKISEPFIGYTLEPNPSDRITNWINENFKAIGNENKFNVTILDASLTQTKFQNEEAKNFDEKNNYIYKLFYLVEFNLYNDSNNLIASTLVETSRSTTSGIYISIEEKENIINDLVYQSLVDLSDESNDLILKFMGDYIL